MREELARRPDRHLNLYELALFSADELPSETQSYISDTERKELEEHLRLCTGCQQLLEQEQFLFRVSKRAPMRDNPDVDCPSTQQWMEIVAGLDSPLHTEEQLNHARNCAPCCARLKQISEQLADDPSDEESRILNLLKSSTPGWQRSLARRMHQLSCEEQIAHAKARKSTFFRKSSLAVASTLLLVLGFWWYSYGRPTKAVNRLLSEAYSEQRTTDLRMTAARYAPVAALRGNEPSEFRRPTALLEAEVLVAKKLATRPDDPFWLDAQGRADLMRDNYSSALSALERAHSYAPDDLAISTDLASAYYLRAEEQNRSEDYGRAVDLLGSVLLKNPRDEIALFNRALSSERLSLYEQAVEDWRHYLEIDPSSAWSSEARRRLQELQEKINQGKKKSATPLFGPAEFLAAMKDHEENTIDGLDLRVERYFELALREWLSEAFRSPRSPSANTARRALASLGELLISRHEDYWLQDFLEALERTPRSDKSVGALTAALQFEETADVDQAHAFALEAALAFHKTGNQPGQLLSEFEASYADQLTHRVSSCFREARARDDPRVVGRYPWLRIEFDLEAAACSNLNDETARKLTSEALFLTRRYHYPSLELRATTFLAQLYEYMGDSSSAWRLAAEGLARYRSGDYPTMRGYSLLVGLNLVAEDTDEWFLDVQILRDAYRFIVDDADLDMRAMEQYRLANAMAMTGDLPAAENTLREARNLFLHSPDGARKQNFEIEAQILLATLDLMRSDPDKVIARLEPLRETVQGITDQVLVFEYFSNLGLAYFASGARVQAARDLSDALTLEEQSLHRNANERERLIWSDKADRVYRAVVELELSRSPHNAFARWEWFKGASLRGTPATQARPTRGSGSDLVAEFSGTPALATLAPSTVVVSYAFLPTGTIAWTYSPEGVRQYRLNASREEVKLLARRFADSCSRPDSPLTTLISESQQLYKQLFAPIDPFLQQYKHVVVEPDGPLWLVPFEALEDSHATYLGDRYAISYSPGLAYISTSPPWPGVSTESAILVAGNPRTLGQKPLWDAEQEAKGIARQFRYSTLLLDDAADYRQIAERVREADIFHFSGHARASPDGIGLLLGDSSVINVDRIQVSEFSRLKLAVLAACNSAKGATGVFDDRDSLARLLVGAGVPEVVASRWVVDSRATSELMQEFYAKLLSGEDVASALGEARREVRRSHEFQHPFYWAGFSTFGKS